MGIEFDLILKAAKAPEDQCRFWKLLIATVLMLGFGYCGETRVMNPWMGFMGGLWGWAFILMEIFTGHAAKASSQCSEAVRTSFNNMRIIVSVGWAIYPAGYCALMVVPPSQDPSVALNVVYNLADFVNKIGFVLACWSCATSESEGKQVE